MSSDHVILKKFPLDFQWATQEPFLFCVHHLDHYPKGQKNFGPDPRYLQGRQMGSDFEARDGFRMYHGEEVPGFPVHPHRGFETITIVRKGYADHADSMGAAGRYGEGDVQWMTAGKGIQHSEMFPLLKQDQENTLELFQIWLNLPKKSKMVAPHFKMLWNEVIPKIEVNSGVQLTLIAGEFNGIKPPAPPPDSWASQADSEVLIYLVKMKPQSQMSLPQSKKQVPRTLYFYEGSKIKINSQEVTSKTGVQLKSHDLTVVDSGDTEIEFLLLQAQEIGEPVVQYGPFVMNTKAEIMQTISEYQQTYFGGWPWDRDDMVHGPKIERFAKLPSGQIEKPSSY